MALYLCTPAWARGLAGLSTSEEGSEDGQPVLWSPHVPVYFCPLEDRIHHSKRKELAVGLRSCYPGLLALLC